MPVPPTMSACFVVVAVTTHHPSEIVWFGRVTAFVVVEVWVNADDAVGVDRVFAAWHRAFVVIPTTNDYVRVVEF